MTPDAEAVYQKLLTVPGDAATMQVLADALEEGGEAALARAYRWAAGRGLWPFQREGRTSRGEPGGKVCDWDGEGRKVPVPDSARLPRDLYDAIRALPPASKVYGGVREAFALLARVLPGEAELDWRLTSRQSDGRILDRDCCPVCGHQFERVREANVCPGHGGGRESFAPDELITEDDDYAWCQ